MSKLCLLIPIVLMFIPGYIRACNDNENFQQFPTFREDANDYWETSYGYVPHSFDSIPFYQSNDFTPSGIWKHFQIIAYHYCLSKLKSFV